MAEELIKDMAEELTKDANQDGVEKTKTLWMLYHIDFWDRPLTGVGIYGESLETGQRVYFNIKGEDIIFSLELVDIEKTLENLKSYKIPESVQSVIISMLQMSESEREDYESHIDGYYIEGSTDEISLFKFPEYEIFTLDHDLMDKLDMDHKRFQEIVGYHADHDPKVYKPFTSPSGCREYYNSPSNVDISHEEKKYLTSVKLQSIEWYGR